MCDARAGPLVGEAIHLGAIAVAERSLRDLNIFAGVSPYLCTPAGQFEIFCRAHILTYCPELSWEGCVMLAQGLWWAKPSTLMQ